MVSLDKVLTSAEQTASVHRKIWHGGETDEAQLKKLLEEHHRWTGSKRARELLDNWAVARTKFVKVFPNEYKRALAELHDRKVELTSSGNNAHIGLEPHAIAAAPQATPAAV
jgi:glutamate synthase (NADPH/NADH) large chain/glutamate synthase (ferredoxin)